MDVSDEERQKIEYLIRLCEARPDDGWKKCMSVEGVSVMSSYPTKDDGAKSKDCMIRGEYPVMLKNLIFLLLRLRDQAIDPEFMLVIEFYDLPCMGFSIASLSISESSA